jgi:hypothetical protein
MIAVFGSRAVVDSLAILRKAGRGGGVFTEIVALIETPFLFE